MKDIAFVTPITNETLQEMGKEATPFTGELSDEQIAIASNHPEFIRRVLELAREYNLVQPK